MLWQVPSCLSVLIITEQTGGMALGSRQVVQLVTAVLYLLAFVGHLLILGTWNPLPSRDTPTPLGGGGTEVRRSARAQCSQLSAWLALLGTTHAPHTFRFAGSTGQGAALCIAAPTTVLRGCVTAPSEVRRGVVL